MSKEVYIIEAKSDLLNTDDCIVKIGISAEPYKRISDIQVGNFCDLELVWHTELYWCAASLLEKTIHDVLSIYKIRGEWFKISRINLERIMVLTKEIDDLIGIDKLYDETDLYNINKTALVEKILFRIKNQPNYISKTESIQNIRRTGKDLRRVRIMAS